MPTYEYRCPNGHDFEHFFRKISDSQVALPCPACGAVAERRISGGAGLLFKGSGFYITDYGKDGKKDQKTAPASKPAGEGTPAAGDAAKGGGDSKGESKGESKGGAGESAAAKPSTSSPPSSSSSGGDK